MSAKKVTAGRETLGNFAPEFARLNDDVLFGEVWSRETPLSSRERSLITVAALVTGGTFDQSLSFHLTKAKDNGVGRVDIAEALTHLAFYAGWPKAWAAFRLAKAIWTEGKGNMTDGARAEDGEINTPVGPLTESYAAEGGGEDKPGGLFTLGDSNETFAKFFTGRSYLKQITGDGLPIFNVTFEPGCRNHWHVHVAKAGGGQILLCHSGRGWYREWGQEARALRPGDAVTVRPGVKHWHGSAKDSWFSHLAVELPGEYAANEWLEPVSDAEYENLG
ncbi:MAG: carboxymuconolactone decarboxylase family protein [Deltaproteobacteria bacterium]|jgi:alkylhydroperoxidase/carboxymuconolactone decarboxylase family protein YurZ/quercetin dioxygenase-like cupin family protein|nr:carboxymuconolactone decarboxylase family protein [Deltaproteobacteria bacterium]